MTLGLCKAKYFLAASAELFAIFVKYEAVCSGEREREGLLNLWSMA
jgi:hypothetical protein